ncbi:MAG: hypothetical protein ACE5K0_05665 [Candidatus Methanofastidiosia archaeon]
MWKESGKGLEKKRFLVYGHTHLADIIKPEEIQKVSKKRESFPTLINLPAWVEDKEHEDVFHSAFLYIDNGGFEFFGWDWKKKEPFFVPKESIIKRNRGKPLKKPEIQNLINMGIPEKLATKWEEPLRL